MIYVGLEEQQRRRIGRLFRPALMLIRGIAKCAWANQTHGQTYSYEKKSIELKRLAALEGIAAHFWVLDEAQALAEMI